MEKPELIKIGKLEDVKRDNMYRDYIEMLLKKRKTGLQLSTAPVKTYDSSQ